MCTHPVLVPPCPLGLELPEVEVPAEDSLSRMPDNRSEPLFPSRTASVAPKPRNGGWEPLPGGHAAHPCGWAPGGAGVQAGRVENPSVLANPRAFNVGRYSEA